MPTVRSVLSAAALVVAWLAGAAATAMRVVDDGPAWSGTLANDLAWTCTWAAFAAVGYVVGRERPGHRIGPMFLTLGFLGAVGDLSQSLAAWRIGDPGAVAAIAGWVSTWAWAPSIGLVVWSMTLFPTGRPVGPGWRMIGPTTFALSTVIATTNAVTLWSERSPRLATLEDVPDTLAGDLVNVFAVLILVGAVGAMATLVLRFRRAQGLERQQMKWGAMGAAVMAPALILGETLFTTGSPALIVDVLGAPVWLALAAGIAITRHGLYDIDRVISRTLGYGAVTALLGALYAGTVLVASATLPAGNDEISVALSTLLVAASFGPLRGRIQRLVDRRFNRARYDAARTIETFAERARDEVELPALRDQVTATVATALQPDHVALWVGAPRSRTGSGRPGRPVADQRANHALTEHIA